MGRKHLDFIFSSLLARIWGAPEYGAIPQQHSTFAMQEGLFEEWLAKQGALW